MAPFRVCALVPVCAGECLHLCVCLCVYVHARESLYAYASRCTAAKAADNFPSKLNANTERNIKKKTGICFVVTNLSQC